MSKTPSSFSACASVALLSCAASLQAADPFVVTVVSDQSGAPASIEVGSSNFLDLVDDVINSQSDFSAFRYFAYDASIDFLGVADAVTFDINSAGTAAVLNIPSIDFTRTFPGGTREQVEDQIEDFFKKEGSGIYADFLNEISRRSAASVTDGNPRSTTASVANDVFNSLGMTPASDLLVDDATASAPNYSLFGIGFNSGTFEAGDLKGSYSDFSISTKFALTDRASLVCALPLNYMTIEDAKIYGVGLSLALPVRVNIMSKTDPMNWRITPTFGYTIRASEDLASGAALLTYGLCSTIDYRLGSNWIVCMVNQVTAFNSMSISYDEYEFDADLTQLIFKNGLRSVHKLSDRIVVDAFLVTTNFSEDAAVSQYWTIGTSVSFKLFRSRNVVLGANYDTGDDFKAWSIGLSSAWKF